MNLDEARKYFADTDHLDPVRTNLALVAVFTELNNRSAILERVRALCQVGLEDSELAAFARDVLAALDDGEVSS